MKKVIKKTKKAFTLIEMVIVLFIISLLLLVMVPNLASQRKDANVRVNEAFQTTLQTQVEMYESNKNVAPTWHELRADKYISDKQFNRADANYEIVKSNSDSNATYQVVLKKDAPKA